MKKKDFKVFSYPLWFVSSVASPRSGTSEVENCSSSGSRDPYGLESLGLGYLSGSFLSQRTLTALTLAELSMGSQSDQK